MIKFFQLGFIFCLSCTLLGCQSTRESVTLVEEKDVSSELLKRVARISDQSDAHTFQEIVFDLIFNTYDMNEHGLIYEGETTYQELDGSYVPLYEFNWGRMEAFLFTGSDLYQVIHSYGRKKNQKREEANGYLFADWQAQDILSVAGDAIDGFPDFFAPHPLVEIGTIPGYTFVEKPNYSTLEEFAESSKYSAIEPLTEILISPTTNDALANPQNYDYSFQSVEDQYLWTITQKMEDTSPLEQPLTLEITMNKNGVLSFVEVRQAIFWSQNEGMMSKEYHYLRINPLSQDQKAFMETFFSAMKEDRIGLGDTFRLFEPFSSQNTKD